MCPAKTQISLGIHPVWSESSLCAQWVAKDPSFLHEDSKDSNQTGRMPRLIWIFAGRTLNLLVLSCRGSIYWNGLFCLCFLLSCFGIYRHRSPLRLDLKLSRSLTKSAKWPVHPAKTQISLHICAVWSVSSLCTLLVAKDPRFLHADSKVSDRTGPRLIWVLTGRSGHFVGFVVLQLK